MTAAIGLSLALEKPAADTNGVFPVTTAGSIACVRTELLRAFLEQMNKARFPYCLLHGFEEYPEVIASDVDFMVHGSDAHRVAAELTEVAKPCGALLVQSFHHETEAWYFVLAKQVGSGVAYLHPDCTADYRRQGRLWIEAEGVLRERQRFKTFFVPTEADEFLYSFIKKVLKRRITAEQWERLAGLYLSSPAECSERIRRYWSAETVTGIAEALLGHDLGWARLRLPLLLAELQASDPVESWRERTRQHWREGRRRLERVANPTGLSIAVCGGTIQRREELASKLGENLRPAFRQTMICVEETESNRELSEPQLWEAKRRSTLVIRTQAAPATQGWLRDEVSFVLTAATGEQRGDGGLGSCVPVDSRLPPEERLAHATRVTLNYLAARLQQRLMRKKTSLRVPATQIHARPGLESAAGAK